MGALLFLFGSVLAAGLYFVLADLLKIPRLATERALISAGRRERSLVKALEALILGWALKLAPLIRMDEYKYRRLESKLTAAGLDMTPQVYTAYSILKPCLILLGIIPCLLILPILSPLIVVLAVLTWFKESRRADELVKARMELIEGELPRFVATIHQELAASRDVLRILENYKKHAGPDFGRELDVLTADMRSSSFEAALARFVHPAGNGDKKAPQCIRTRCGAVVKDELGKLIVAEVVNWGVPVVGTTHDVCRADAKHLGTTGKAALPAIDGIFFY